MDASVRPLGGGARTIVRSRVANLLDHLQHPFVLEAAVQPLLIHLLRPLQACSLVRELLKAHRQAVHASRLEASAFVQSASATLAGSRVPSTAFGAISNAADVAACVVVRVRNDVGPRAPLRVAEREADTAVGAAEGSHGKSLMESPAFGALCLGRPRWASTH